MSARAEPGRASGGVTGLPPCEGGLARVRVALPAHLRDLARVRGDVEFEVERDADGALTIARLLDALEASYPMLRGTIRSHETGARRSFVRYFACGEDVSHDPPDAPLSEAVCSEGEVFRVLGAIAGG